MSYLRLIDKLHVMKDNLEHLQYAKFEIGNAVCIIKHYKSLDYLEMNFVALNVPIYLHLKEVVDNERRGVKKHVFLIFDEKTPHALVYYDRLLKYDSMGIEFSFFEKKKIVTCEFSEFSENYEFSEKGENGNKEVPNESKSIDSTNKNKELANEYDLLNHDFSSFWKQNILTDVDIQCGSEIFKAHKAILAARSTYFAAMFQTPMKESKENRVVIQNTKPEVLQVVLSYIYSGKKPDMNNTETAVEVLAAADLYNIPGLKRVCSAFLRSSLSLSNVVNLLVFADLHDPDLKEAAVQFASDHYESLKGTEDWTNLQKQNPSLIISVMTEKIENLNSK